MLGVLIDQANRQKEKAGRGGAVIPMVTTSVRPLRPGGTRKNKGRSCIQEPFNGYRDIASDNLRHDSMRPVARRPSLRQVSPGGRWPVAVTTGAPWAPFQDLDGFGCLMMNLATTSQPRPGLNAIPDHYHASHSNGFVPIGFCDRQDTSCLWIRSLPGRLCLQIADLIFQS